MANGYTPNNSQVFLAAFSGAVGGAQRRLSIAFNQPPGVVSPQATAVALAFAQGLDTAWGANPATPQDITAISVATTLLMRDADPSFLLTATTPSSWASQIPAIIQAALAGDAAAATLGISFANAGGPFNSPFPQQWQTAPPVNTNDAINRISAVVSAQFGPIPLLTGPTGPSGPTGLAMIARPHLENAILGPTGPSS